MAKQQGKQDFCFSQSRSSNFMDVYDRLPDGIRERLRNSRHNICSACVDEYNGDKLVFICEAEQRLDEIERIKDDKGDL